MVIRHGGDVAPGSAYAVAAAVADPELPMVTIGDLGVLRDVAADGEAAVVTVTPTYSGCPAMDAIRADIARELREAGYTEVEIHTVFAPAWTTDWITPEGRAKLAAANIAPPGAVREPSAPLGAVREQNARRADDAAAGVSRGGRGLLPLLPPPAPACPRCDSGDVVEISRFGPTACTSLWRCRSCAEPFEHMKAH